MTILRTFLSLLLAAVLALLVFATGCGGSSKAATPVGNFSVSSLSGTYAFVFSGNDANGPFAVAGTLAADGGGNISGGALDVNSGQTQPPTPPSRGPIPLRPTGAARQS
jgi:hypothetical protein